MLSHISKVSLYRAGRLLVVFSIGMGLLCLCLPQTARAVSTWDGSDDTNWNTATNWDVAPGAAEDLIFSGVGQTFQPLNNDIVGGDFNSITFNSDVFTNDVGGDDLMTVTGNSFSIGTGGIVASSIGTGRTIEMQNNMTLTDNVLLNNTQANTVLLLSGNISGAFSLSKSGSGTVRLTGDNSFSGGFVVNAGGLLQFTGVADTGTNSALGSAGTISIRNTAEYIGTDPAGHSTNRTVVFGNGGGGYNFLNASGVGPLTFTGQFGNGSPRNVQLAGTGVGVVTGTITAAGAATYTLLKNGTGTWVIGGTTNNNITRARVQNGTLIVAKNNALGAGTAATNEALIDPGATLGFQGDINHSTAKPILVSGTGDAGNSRAGAIDNISGINSFAGDITLAGDTTFGATAGQLTLTGLIAEDLVSKSYAVTKNGPGTIVFSSATGNTYQGGTTVSQGALLVSNTSGSGTGSGAVSVSATATLGGDGIIAGPITVEGTISPGFSPGTLTTLDDVTFENGSEYYWEINDWTGVASTNFDELAVGGTLNINASVSEPFVLTIATLDNLNMPGPMDNYDKFMDNSWVIATAAGGITGLTDDNYSIDLSNFQNPEPGIFTLSLAAGNTQLVLNYAAPPVPEPNTLGLLGAGMIYLLARRRKGQVRI